MSQSIALVVLDSVRQDFFNKYFDWLPGIWFSRAYSTGNYSIPAHGSLFTGKYPSETGVHAKSQSLDCTEPVLAEMLQHAGYQTRAHTANHLVGADFDFDRGFNEFNSFYESSCLYPWREVLDLDDPPTEIIKQMLRCISNKKYDTFKSLKQAYKIYNYEDSGIQETLDILPLINFGQREFLFMNFMEAHWPYWGSGGWLRFDSNPLEEQAKTIPSGDVDLTSHMEGYRDCIQYLSKKYQSIYKILSEHFDYVITLSDHGDLFGEHGARAHFYGLYKHLINIPIVISDGRENQAFREDIVSLVDVFATICRIAGIDTGRRGIDLRETKQTDPRLSEFHGFRGKRRQTLLNSGFEKEEIDNYDTYLCGVAMQPDYYGHETANGFIEQGVADGNPSETLCQMKDEVDVQEITEDSVAVSEETMQNLRDFGYL